MPGSIRSRMTRSAGSCRSRGRTSLPDVEPIDAMSGLLEIVRDERGDVVVIFDHQDLRHGETLDSGSMLQRTPNLPTPQLTATLTNRQFTSITGACCPRSPAVERCRGHSVPRPRARKRSMIAGFSLGPRDGTALGVSLDTAATATGGRAPWGHAVVGSRALDVTPNTRWARRERLRSRRGYGASAGQAVRAARRWPRRAASQPVRRSSSAASRISARSFGPSSSMARRFRRSSASRAVGSGRRAAVLRASRASHRLSSGARASATGPTSWLMRASFRRRRPRPSRGRAGRVRWSIATRPVREDALGQEERDHHRIVGWRRRGRRRRGRRQEGRAHRRRDRRRRRDGLGSDHAPRIDSVAGELTKSEGQEAARRLLPLSL